MSASLCHLFLPDRELLVLLCSLLTEILLALLIQTLGGD